MPRYRNQQPPQGELRQSQILTTFGPGSMVDLVNQSVIISGLDHWHGYKEKEIEEERLRYSVAKQLGAPVRLYAPPIANDDPNKPQTGIDAFVFPNWFVAQTNTTIKRGNKIYRTRPLIPFYPERGKYRTDDNKTVPVVPIRFVQACPKGHISDINWRFFAQCPSNCRGRLYIDEGGAGNDFNDIFIRCEKCKRPRPLYEATLKNQANLGYCQGDRPWLGQHAKEECYTERNGQKKPTPNRLLVRSASNAYFSQILSVISIPDNSSKLREAVTSVYEDFLQYVEAIDELPRERRKQKVANALEGFDDETVWQELQRRKNNQVQENKSIKQVEIETLLSDQPILGADKDDSDFYAYAKPIETDDADLKNKLEKIVLIPRLREVMALVGFTRFEPTLMGTDGEFEEDEESLNIKRAAIALEPHWVPTIENKGEGVFIAFRKEAIETWVKSAVARERRKELFQGFEQWRIQKNLEEKKIAYPGLAYTMLHSLSHLLITSIALECGYSASAIKERIYASDSGYGILLYTGTTGSEGTLGGIIEVGKRIEYYLKQAIAMAELCSNDPVCSQHTPSQTQEERYLHGCACHGCLLIAETSCEKRNEYLDRALAGKILGHNCGFFSS